MKPLKLTINAFGPYAEKIEIDFEKFGDNGIYLVAGETGAGKTTIFDALSFALFGESSGSNRSEKSLKSDFVDEKTIGYVDLEFLSHGDKYFVHRECPYYKTKKNGERKIESEKVEFKKPNGMTVSNKKDADKEIAEIIGIDADQFSQIVMIAQGEFKKFLTAKSDEKVKIFRNIFKTDIFNRFQEEIKKEYSIAQKDKHDSELKLIHNLNSVDCGENEELKKKQELATSNVQNTNKLLKLLNVFVEEDSEKLKKLNSEKEENQKEHTTITQEIAKNEEIDKNRKTLEEKQKQLPEIEKAQKEAKQKYQEVQKQVPEKDKLNTEISELEQSLPDYEKLRENLETLEIKEKNKEDVSKSVENLEESKEQKQEQNESNKKELSEIENVDVELQKTEANLEKLEQKKVKLSDILTQNNEYKMKSENLKYQEYKYDDLCKKSNQLMDIAKKVYNIFIGNYAGILAKDLKDGEKCPVCGSVHHPELAQLSENSVTQKDYENAKNMADKAQQECIKELNKKTEIETSLAELKKSLKKQVKDELALDDISDIDEKIDVAKKENQDNIKNLDEKLKSLNIKLKRKEELKNFIEKFDENQKKLKNKIEEEKENATQLDKEIASLKATNEQIKSKLRYDSKDEVQKVLKEKQQKLKEMKDAFEKAEKEKSETEKKLAEIEGQIKGLADSVKDKPVVDLEKLKAEKVKLEEEGNDLSEKEKEIHSRHKNNSDLLVDIQKSKEDFDKKSEKFDIYTTLKNTVSGNLAGQQKITFENYVLQIYFEQIVNAANIRFKEMTSSQFELRIQKEKGGNSKTGLDLSVFDYYTAKERDINSLSGGESFKAALALSLGLSDIVQQQSGGVQIDTMFIDEGFGSLDSESLEQTMRTLTELSGNKTLIGIISHVAELREKIDKKIIVSKSQFGSKLKIELP